VFDTFQVCLRGTKATALPLPETGVPGIIPAGATVRLSRPRLHPMMGVELARDGQISTGPRVSMSAPTIGRFTFSSEPGPGYRLEALAEETTLHFLANNENYSITTDAPIMDQPGS